MDWPDSTVTGSSSASSDLAALWGGLTPRVDSLSDWSAGSSVSGWIVAFRPLRLALRVLSPRTLML